jgi:hypothetical protein
MIGNGHRGISNRYSRYGTSRNSSTIRRPLLLPGRSPFSFFHLTRGSSSRPIIDARARARASASASASLRILPLDSTRAFRAESGARDALN